MSSTVRVILYDGEVDLEGISKNENIFLRTDGSKVVERIKEGLETLKKIYGFDNYLVVERSGNIPERELVERTIDIAKQIVKLGAGRAVVSEYLDHLLVYDSEK